ncbi:MAG TPA: MarR family transcriptional regulator [Nitrososphaerales archaeon]|nr:MarR family transcriptional regulator [Nitrososphaerales archaeon]
MSFPEGFQSSGPIDEGDFEDLEERPNPNDIIVLRALSEDEDARDLSFQGIKRKLGLHQETLSRSLHRLQRDGFVERLDHAYRISPKGITSIAGEKSKLPSLKLEPVDPYAISLLRARLPPDINVPELVNSLSYKWFGNLRWLGSTQTPESATLSWMTEDSDLKISVRIKEDLLTIETFPTGSGSISDATRSAFELFDHVSKNLKGTLRASSDSSFDAKAG